MKALKIFMYSIKFLFDPQTCPSAYRFFYSGAHIRGRTWGGVGGGWGIDQEQASVKSKTQRHWGKIAGVYIKRNKKKNKKERAQPQVAPGFERTKNA